MENNTLSPLIKEFVRGHTKLFIGQSSLWSFGRLTEAMKVLTAKNYINNVQVLLNFCNTDMFTGISSSFPKRILEQFNCAITQGVYNADAFRMSREVEEQYENLLGLAAHVGKVDKQKTSRWSWLPTLG
ncbi:hypothetical protein [Paenibacillus popilliae]|uniref:hypothetical protein n=1 Tax=Paenibacillus popilliae TaxID=78057 RepID=UPI0005A733DC|nr:hypothetical protein [Paenibacillus popilliae]